MGRRNLRPEAGRALHTGFVQRLTAHLGEEANALLAALETDAPTSIRLNPRKPFPAHGDPVPWCATGRYLPYRPGFTFDPLLHAGAYYVQEASSMLIEQAVLATGIGERDVLALDLCAAPGGKSTHLLALLSSGSLLVANEIDAARRAVLAENLWKQGAHNAVVAGSDPDDLHAMPGAFDLILVDAPCSGEGLFRRDAFAREQWSPQLVAQCSARQHGILEAAWQALAPGGHLIYSTCTWELEENEAQAARLAAMGGAPVELPLRAEWNVERTEHAGAIGYRCYPHRARGEGFFISLIRKAGVPAARGRGSAPEPGPTDLPWIGEEHALRVREANGVRYARPAAWAAAIDALRLNVAHPGIPVAEAKGPAWAPHAAAALSGLLDASALPVIEADGATALAYLRGMALPAQGAQGPALLRYRGIALGWLHGAGNRWNNRWPAPWRVRQAASSAPPVSWSEP